MDMIFYMENTVIQLVVLLFLVLLNGFFAMSEIALITLNDTKIKVLANHGDKKAKKIVKLTSNSSKFLATIQVGVTLSGFLTSASASQSFSGNLAEALSFLPFSKSVIGAISTIIITIILSYFSLVLGELVPKKIAMQKAEQISFKVVGVLLFIATICGPFIKFLSSSTNLVVRLLGFDPLASEQSVTEEEIRMLVDVGEEKGVIQDNEKQMINNIFDFNNTIVTEVMTHRTDMAAVESKSNIHDVAKLANKMGYSRIPVYKDDLDNIIGIVYVKDLIKYIFYDHDQTPKIEDIMRKAMFVPESQKCDEVFAQMTNAKTQIAIIVDEYGGTEGLVTMEDLLESIVGNIQDEYDNEREEITKISENSFTVEGTASIDEISEILRVKLPEGDYDTIAGLVVDYLGRIPLKDEHPSIILDDIKFTVQKVEEHRISQILIEKLKDSNTTKSE